MKKQCILVFVLLLSYNFLSAQFKAGIKAGVHNQDLTVQQLINNEEGQLLDILKTSEYGLHYGVFAQITAKKLIIQPEIVFNSNKTTFVYEDPGQIDPNQDLDIKFQHLDIPILFQYKLGPFRFGGGPVGHVFVNSKAELVDKEVIVDTFKQLTYGYQIGAGLNLAFITLDLRYENGFKNDEGSITIGSTEYTYSNDPSRIVASIGLKF